MTPEGFIIINNRTGTRIGNYGITPLYPAYTKDGVQAKINYGKENGDPLLEHAEPFSIGEVEYVKGFEPPKETA